MLKNSNYKTFSNVFKVLRRTMVKMENSNDPYKSLREKLQMLKWPRVYMFKFIVKKEKVQEVKKLFGPAEVYTKESRNGKYISVTGKEMMMNSERVIDRYKEAAKIDGLMSL